MILGILLGNTSVRVGVFDGARLVHSSRIEWSELDARGGEIDKAARRYAVTSAVAGSVRDDQLARLERWLPRSLPPLRIARRDFPLPIENRYERPEEAGTDRLLNAIAARARAPGRAAVVVDFGTAVSISVVTGDGAFAGGLIAAGSRAAAEGLRELTPMLPRVDLRDVQVPVDFVARATEPAMKQGLYWQVRGGVQAMVRGLRASLGEPVSVLATGGEAVLFAPAIEEIDAHVPDLTLEGLAIACEQLPPKP